MIENSKYLNYLIIMFCFVFFLIMKHKYYLQGTPHFLLSSNVCFWFSLWEWRLGKIIPTLSHFWPLLPPPLLCPGFMGGKRGTEVQTEELSSAVCYKPTNTNFPVYIAPSSLPIIFSAIDCRRTGSLFARSNG